MNTTSSRAAAIRHDELMRRLQNPADAASAPEAEPEPVDPAALEAELADLKAQWERMVWERSQGPDRGSFINEKWDDHQTAMNRVAARIGRLEHILDGLRLKEREQSQQDTAAAQQAARQQREAESLPARVAVLEVTVDRHVSLLIRLGHHELKP